MRVKALRQKRNKGTISSAISNKAYAKNQAAVIGYLYGSEDAEIANMISSASKIAGSRKRANAIK